MEGKKEKITLVLGICVLLLVVGAVIGVNKGFTIAEEERAINSRDYNVLEEKISNLLVSKETYSKGNLKEFLTRELTATLEPSQNIKTVEVSVGNFKTIDNYKRAVFKTDSAVEISENSNVTFNEKVFSDLQEDLLITVTYKSYKIPFVGEIEPNSTIIFLGS